MLIDWFTVGAQTLNFLILVWLMKRYLYKPVLDAIDAREQRIATELADAAQKQAQADTERSAFQQKNADFDQQRESLARKASADADAERQRLLAEARAAADALGAKRHAALASELQALQQDITQRSQHEIFAIARKLLTELADTTLEARMTEVFCQRLLSMDAPAKAELTKALTGSQATTRVRSAFALSPAQQAAISQAIDATIQGKLPIAFETKPEVIGGIELSANGWKFAWNVSDCLASLERSMGAPMENAAGKAPATA
jgi:F-type H+-transporting ATPase subunit b